MIMDLITNIIKSYEAWVAANPETVGDLETTTKWISYFVAGRFSDSNVVSELIYSLTNILVLYNDHVIKARSALTSEVAERRNAHVDSSYRVKVMLTTLEYCEVLIEVSAKRFFGNVGKWVFIVIIQLAKAAGRYFILMHSADTIIMSPAIQSLNRRAFIKKCKEDFGFEKKNQNTSMKQPSASFTFSLKRSGRIVRKVDGAPPMHLRDFKLQKEVRAALGDHCPDAPMPRAMLQAELPYVVKPLLHLAAMGIFGEKSWKQYAISLALDLCSIRIYYKNRHQMDKEQKLQMSRRCIYLLMYLMRSPFYEQHSSKRIEGGLAFLSDNIPLLTMIARPLMEYIPHWQDTYFYMWST